MNRRYRLVFNRALGLFQVASETTRLRNKAGKNRDAAGTETSAPAARLHAMAAAIALGLGALALPAQAVDHVITNPETGAAGGMGGNGTYSSGGSSGTGTVPSGAYANAGGAGGYPGDGQNGAGAAGSGGAAGTGGGHGWGGTGGNLATQGYGGGGGGGGGPGGSGGGGGGGVGLTLATGDTLDNSSVISGGDGGHAGLAFAAAGRGGGGGGGAGIFAAAGVDIINSGTIQGGTGGNSMYGGGGGTAVILTGGSTLINSGTIYGGLSRVTSTQDTAIELGGGGNTLELRAASVILGNVISHGGDTLALGGISFLTNFNVSQIGAGAQYRGFDNFVKTGTGGWTLNGTTTALTPWTIEQGTLNIASDGALGDVTGTLTLAGGTLRTSTGINSARNIHISAGAGTIDNNGTYNTFSGVISGGQLVLTGGGTTTLTGINTHTGGTTVLGGRVAISADANLGDGGSLALDGGGLRTEADLTLTRVVYVGYTGQPGGGGPSTIDNGGHDIQLSGGLTGNGNLYLDGSGTTTLTGTNTHSGNIAIRAGRLALDQNTELAASTLAVFDGATFGVSTGTIGTLDNAGTMIIGAAGEFTVNGDFSNSGTFQVNVANMTNYGRLETTGTATLGGELFVFTNPMGGFSAGTLADIITAGSISGTFDSYRDDSVLFDFTPVYGATSVSLAVAAAGTGGGDNGGNNGGGDNGGGDNGGNNGGGDNGGGNNGGLSLVETIVASHGNSPAFGAARVLGQTFANDPTGALSARFMSFSTGQQVNDAVSQSLPLLTGSGTLATQNVLSDINSIIQARLNGQLGLSSGDAFANSQVWVKAFGSRADQNHDGAEAGFEADTYGVSLGVDGEITKGHRVGLAFATAKADIDSDSRVAPQSAEVDIYQLVGYGSYQLSASGEVNYQLGFGQNQTDGKRVLPSFGLVAKADYDSFTTYAGVGYVHTLQLSEQTKLIPSVRIDYSKIEDDSYNEKGADALNLHVSGNTSEALVIGADGRVEHRLNDRATLQFNVGFGYDLMADRDALTAVYAGAPGASFVTYGQDVDPWIANGGIGFAYQATDALEITARYDAQTRSRFDNQTASLKALWKF